MQPRTAEWRRSSAGSGTKRALLRRATGGGLTMPSDRAISSDTYDEISSNTSCLSSTFPAPSSANETKCMAGNARSSCSPMCSSPASQPSGSIAQSWIRETASSMKSAFKVTSRATVQVTACWQSAVSSSDVGALSRSPLAQYLRLLPSCRFFVRLCTRLRRQPPDPQRR